MARMEMASGSWDALPLFSSLTEFVLVYGAPRIVLVANLVISLIFIVNFGFWYILGITGALQFLSMYISKDDALFFDCYLVYLPKKSYYSS